MHVLPQTNTMKPVGDAAVLVLNTWFLMAMALLELNEAVVDALTGAQG